MYPDVTSLVSRLRSKCDSSTCSSLESCLLDPRGDTCVDTYGSSVAPYGLVSALPQLQTWVDTVKEGAVLNCWKTSDIRPVNSPTEGPESLLVSFDECETLGRSGVIQSQHDNKFFGVTSHGLYSVSVSYTPVIFGGKPIRVSTLV